jgi:tetratricopeptide (TPR) repeat protein
MKGFCRPAALAALAMALVGVLQTAAAADSPNATVVGTEPLLSDGARALQFREYEQGVRLTLEGLKLSVSRRERAAGLNNLCAGYAGLQRYDEALAACNEALTLNIARWRVFNNRALALLGKKQVAAARRDVEAGLAINPDSRSLKKVLKLVEIAEISPKITIAAVDSANPGR